MNMVQRITTTLLRAALLIPVVMAALPVSCPGFQKTIALKEFQTRPGPIYFYGAASQHDLFIPLYGKEAMESIELELHYVNSASLLSDISQIVVMADGFVVGQTGLSGSSHSGRKKIDIPVELLNGDTMHLGIMVNQHYESDCENSYARQLWTEINPVKSRITFTWKHSPVQPDLRHWINMFSPANPFLTQAAIVIPEENLQWLRAACSISAWLTSVRSYRPLYFQISRTLTLGMPNIVLGPAEFIRDLIDRTQPTQQEHSGTDSHARPSLSEKITGPSAAVMSIPLQEDSSVPCLMVTGMSLNQVQVAADKLASVQQPWPENRFLALSPERPQAPPAFRRHCLMPEKDYSFKQLGLYGNMMFQGMGVIEHSITLHIPPEIFRQENRYAKLSLDIVYSAGLREDSVLQVNINQTLAGSIPLNNPEGKTFSGYTLNIPMSFFRPGHNDLSFRVVMKPFRAQKCAPVCEESMVTTIMNSSEIYIPAGYTHYTVPDLALLMDDLFPYSYTLETGSSPALIVGDAQDPHIFQAAVNLSALFARRLETPFNYLQITENFSHDLKGDSIFLGTVDQLPEELKQTMPIFGSSDTIRYIVPQHRERILAIRNRMRDSRMLITEMEFPQDSTRIATIITAQQASTIDRGIGIVAKDQSHRLHSDTALIDTTSHEIMCWDMNRRISVGSMGLQGAAGNWLTSRPEYYYPLTAAVVLIAGLLIAGVVRRRKRMRTKPYDE